MIEKTEPSNLSKDVKIFTGLPCFSPPKNNFIHLNFPMNCGLRNC
jgi:hypothetical protein